MKPEQERVRHLLTDTVTLLCKNGLQFQDELKVEGVIGITLDNNEVFVVHINEAFGVGGVEKPPPKDIGTGAVGATSLAELPGLVSTPSHRARITQPRGFLRGSRGTSRGRPFGSSMRRGSLNSRRMPMGRQVMGGSRGRGMQMNRPPPVIPLSSPIKSSHHNMSSPPPHIVKTEITSDDDVVLTDFNSEMPNYPVKQEPQSPRNGQLSDRTEHTNQNRNSFVNLSLDDMTQGNLPFFDPMNDNIDNQSLEPPAKRSHSDSEPNLASPLDSLMNVVSNNSSIPHVTSPESTHTMPSTSQLQSSLAYIKQEPSTSQDGMQHPAFPPSLQPMGGAPDWSMDSAQKSLQDFVGAASSDTVSVVSC